MSKWTMRAWRALPGVLLALALPAMPAPAAQAGCAGRGSCLENPSFVVDVSDVRTSISGRYRVVAATLRFQNRLDRPLILGYVNNSGVVTDDQGNRYTVGGSGVRGIGVISGNNVETKFTLAPGESSEARFEFAWDPGRAILGTRYEMDLAVREIDAVAGNQLRLGRERVLHFATLGIDAPGAATPPATVASAPAVPVVPPGDPCAGVARCAAAGPFVAQVIAVTPQGGPKDRNHTLVLTMRLRNISDRPAVLAYKSNTSNATDNLGNQYYWGRAGTYDTNAKGIGTVTSREANAQFALAPGAAGNATFTVIRYNSGGKQLGAGWVYDVVIDELEVLASQQVRVAREHSLHFTDLTASGVAAGAASVDDAVKGLKDLFKGKKK